MGTDAKIVVLIRHAKAVSPYGDYKDIDRPLTSRGAEEAKGMANWLREKLALLSEFTPLFLTSTALRTQETAAIFSETLSYPLKNIQPHSQLYLPQKDIFYEVIEDVVDSINTLFVFSHNNGITDFANSLTNNRIDVIPPCGVAVFKVETTAWKNIRNTTKEWLWFKTPDLLG